MKDIDGNGSYTLKELIEFQQEINKNYPERSPEYRKAVEESNKKIHDYEQKQARMLVKASKFVAHKGK